MGLDTLGKDFAETGMMPGFLSGQTHGAGLASTIAGTRQKGLESDRYAQATPLELERMGLANESSRLGNLQGKADEQAGVHGLKAKQTAMEAQAVMQKLPYETKNKIASMVKEKNNQVLEIMEQTLTTTGSSQAAMEAVLGLYPEMAQDPGWARAQQQYMSLPPDKVLQEVKLARHKLASSNAFADPTFQGKYLEEDQRQQGRMELADKQGQFGLREAGIRAAAGGGSGSDKQNAAEIIRDLSGQAAEAYAAGNKALGDKLIYQINAINKARPDEPEFAGIPGKPGNMVKPLETGAPAPAPSGYVRGADGVLRKAPK